MKTLVLGEEDAPQAVASDMISGRIRYGLQGSVGFWLTSLHHLKTVRGRIAGCIESADNWFHTEKINREVIRRETEVLDDRTLRDIGLLRTQVTAAALQQRSRKVTVCDGKA
jgi:uncharacterized protein YjiS (DUF1127 family)